MYFYFSKIFFLQGVFFVDVLVLLLQYRIWLLIHRCAGVCSRVVPLYNTGQRSSDSTAEGRLTTTPLVGLFSRLKSFSPPVTWTVYYWGGTMRVWRRAAQVAKRRRRLCKVCLFVVADFKTAWPPLYSSRSHPGESLYSWSTGFVCACMFVYSGELWCHHFGWKLHYHQAFSRGYISLIWLMVVKYILLQFSLTKYIWSHKYECFYLILGHAEHYWNDFHIWIVFFHTTPKDGKLQVPNNHSTIIYFW